MTAANDNPAPTTTIVKHPASLWLANIEADGIQTVLIHKRPRRK